MPKDFKKGDRVKLLEIEGPERWPFKTIYPPTTGTVDAWVDHLAAYRVFDVYGEEWYVTSEYMEKLPPHLK
jgi:hypothetical protein